MLKIYPVMFSDSGKYICVTSDKNFNIQKNDGMIMSVIAGINNSNQHYKATNYYLVLNPEKVIYYVMDECDCC